MSGLFGSSASSSNAQTHGDLGKDVPVKDLPEDSISDISFSTKSDHLAVSSWDKKVRIYEIDAQGNSQGKAIYEHEAPVLCCTWSQDGSKVISGGGDKAARMLDLGSGSSTAQQVAAHDQPIRCIKTIEVNGSPMLVTGSWDKTVKYWDMRQQAPAANLTCQERVYCMDVRDKLLVIGTADRYIQMVNLNSPTTFYKTMQSPLKWQTRVISCFIDASGFAIGSVEGRCAIQYVEDKDKDYNFSFKCHRQQSPTDRLQTNVYSVNAISFHPQFGTFSTAGGDHMFNFWDKDAKHRLKGFGDTGQSIVATDFNRTGTIFAYACSYDWSKGYAQHSPQSINKVMLHPVLEEEVKCVQVDTNELTLGKNQVHGKGRKAFK